VIVWHVVASTSVTCLLLAVTSVKSVLLSESSRLEGRYVAMNRVGLAGLFTSTFVTHLLLAVTSVKSVLLSESCRLEGRYVAMNRVGLAGLFTDNS